MKILADKMRSKGRGTRLLPAQFIWKKKKSYHDRPANRKKWQRSRKDCHRVNSWYGGYGGEESLRSFTDGQWFWPIAVDSPPWGRLGRGQKVIQLWFYKEMSNRLILHALKISSYVIIICLLKTLNARSSKRRRICRMYYINLVVNEIIDG